MQEGIKKLTKNYFIVYLLKSYAFFLNNNFLLYLILAKSIQPSQKNSFIDFSVLLNVFSSLLKLI